MEIWEPKLPGTLWATSGLLRESFTFYTVQFEYAQVSSISTRNNVFVFHLLLTFEIYFFCCVFEGVVNSSNTLTSPLHCADEIYNILTFWSRNFTFKF